MTVLHYVPRWLPLSEQYVHAAISRSRYPAVVASAETPENRDAFRGPRVVSLAGVGRVPARARRPVRTAALAAIAVATRARVLHAHFGYRAPDVIGVSRRLRLPLVLSLHGHDATAFVTQWPHHLDVVLGDAAAVIVPSRFLASRVADLGVDASKLHVIPAGVDVEWFAPAPVPPAPVVAFVGRLVEKKGIDVLVAAFATVRARVPGARLLVLGDGPLRVHVTGDGVEQVAPDATRRASQVRDILRSARVVATPSRTAGDGDAESLLLVNLEAQASGRPVVTTRHGGIPEFVEEGRSALLVDEGDPDGLADALVRVLTDDALAARLAEAGPQVAARFEVGSCAKRVDVVYDTLVRR